MSQCTELIHIQCTLEAGHTTCCSIDEPVEIKAGPMLSVEDALASLIEALEPITVPDGRDADFAYAKLLRDRREAARAALTVAREERDEAEQRTVAAICRWLREDATLDDRIYAEMIERGSWRK